jgi:hypothetical protein
MLHIISSFDFDSPWDTMVVEETRWTQPCS